MRKKSIHFLKEEKKYMPNEKLIPIVPEKTGTCKITFPDGLEIELPLLQSTDNQKFIDIRTLKKQSNHFTFDPGYTCTGSCVSQITSIKGEKGILTYRGYKIADLANNCCFLETSYLLLYGELPCKNQLKKFEDTIVDEMCLHTNMIKFYDNFDQNSHPMAIMVGMVGTLSAFMKETNYAKSEYERQITAIKIISKMPMIAALAFRTSKGLPLVFPKKKYGYIENFLRMMFKNTIKDWKCDKRVIEAIEKLFILHADHEQNASTSTVRISSSSLANPYACIASGIASLWGPNHGGANEAAIDMLEQIGSIDNIDAFIDEVKSKKKRLMGFGHRVYKNFDPRALIAKKMAKQISDMIGQKHDRKLLDIALALEKRALSDEYFIKRKLYPNVDFYTGIIYSSIGIPKNMFTAMFAIARSVGWITQLNESNTEKVMRIGRPRQLYVGEIDKKFKSIEEREEKDLCITVPRQCDIFNLPIL